MDPRVLDIECWRLTVRLRDGNLREARRASAITSLPGSVTLLTPQLRRISCVKTLAFPVYPHILVSHHLTQAMRQTEPKRTQRGCVVKWRVRWSTYVGDVQGGSAISGNIPLFHL